MILINIFIPMIVLVQLQTSSANKICEHHWKENLGLSDSKEDFQNLLQIHGNFLSQNFTYDPVKDKIKVEVETCSISPECRIYTMIDKKKENSMTMCITVNDTQSCYALTCSCQKSRKKRAINSPVNLGENEKPSLNGKFIPAQCNISIDNRDYIQLKNKPCAATSYSAYSNASIGYFDDTTTTVLICDRNVKEKDRNIWLNILTFLFGGVVGAIVGIFVTCVCFKRKSIKKFLEVNCLYRRYKGSNANEKKIQSEFDDPEYSEIPGNLQLLETSSKNSSRAVTIDINNVNYQRNISVQKKKVLSSRGKLSDSVCITMSRQQNDASGNTRVSEPCSDDYEIPINKTGFLTCNVDPATGCNVYHSLEDIPLVENEEDGNKTPTQCSAKAFYHVLSAEKETSFTEEVEDHSLVTDNPCLFTNKNDKPFLCTTKTRNTADRVCDRQENTPNTSMGTSDVESCKAPAQSIGKFTFVDKTDSENIIKQDECSNAENLCNPYHVVEDNPKFNLNHEKTEFPTHISTPDKSPATETFYFELSTSSMPAAKEQIKIEAKNINISD